MRLISASSIWLVAIIACTIFTKDLFAPFLNPHTFLAFGLWGAAAFIVGFAIRSVVKEKRGVVAIVIVVVGAALIIIFGDRLAIDARFAMARADYETELERIREGQPASHPDFAYMEETGAGLRVAFYWKRGIVDNWSGIVFDPSDSLADASLSSGQRSYFGGDLIYSRHLSGHWYLCGFT